MKGIMDMGEGVANFILLSNGIGYVCWTELENHCAIVDCKPGDRNVCSDKGIPHGGLPNATISRVEDVLS
ncbi:hypothetical protein CEXT_130381 [Caerostris extrusa]|uniref:Uncharacterized protein n=1 Tax=Caerostris extrusa TaxID=172846 RepID=A0AAV4PPP6_CAEEX|nr:hypothetical protein CEXT_130381 [Caerostris extrusa]